MTSHRIFYLVGHTGKSDKHGGVQRADQTRDDIFHDFAGSVEVVNIRGYSKADLLASLLLFPVVFHRLRAYPISIVGWVRACAVYRILRKCLREADTHVFFLEGWDDLYLIAGLLLKESHGCYVPFPQNIDGMRPGTTARSFRSVWDRFGVEVSVYRGAAVNVAICDFDRAIMETFSANACVYPYYPVEERLESLRLVKSARSNVSSDQVLVLGTLGNPPTRVAMTALLSQASTSRLGKFKIVVAGFGTEALAEYSSPEITVLGSVSEETLNELMGSVHCVIAPTLQTTGFLTKLVDMNLAGVPVVMLGRYIQASHMEDHGIYFAESFADLPGVLDKVAAPRREFQRVRLKDLLTESWPGGRKS